MTQTHTHTANNPRALRRPMGQDDPHPVHARDAERWSEMQWRRWCVEQAVTARSGAYAGVEDQADRLFRFMFPLHAPAPDAE